MKIYKNRICEEQEASRKNTDHNNCLVNSPEQTLGDNVDVVAPETVKKNSHKNNSGTICSETLGNSKKQYRKEKSSEKDTHGNDAQYDSLSDYIVSNDKIKQEVDEQLDESIDGTNLVSLCGLDKSGYSLCSNQNNGDHLSLISSENDKGSYKKPHKCDQCETSFRTPYELERHGRIHSGERPFKCQLCDMCFKRKDHVEVHMRRHIEDRRHVCDICGMWFVTSSCLLRHRRRTHQVFDPPSNTKPKHQQSYFETEYSDDARCGVTEQVLSPSDNQSSLNMERTRRKCKRPKSKAKVDSTYRPGGKTVCILKKRKLRNRSYSFAELEDDIECFETDEEDTIPYLKIQTKSIKQEDDNMITEVCELEHSLFPTGFFSHAAPLDHMVLMGEVSKLLSDRSVPDFKENEIEDSCASDLAVKSGYSVSKQNEQADVPNPGSESEESEVPLISCDVSFDEPENEFISSVSKDSKGKKKKSSHCPKNAISGTGDEENDLSVDTLNKHLKENTSENDSNKILDKIEKGTSTEDGEKGTSTEDGEKGTSTEDGEKGTSFEDGEKGTTTEDGEKGMSTEDDERGTSTQDYNSVESDKMQVVEEEHALDNNEQYSQLLKIICQSLTNRSQAGGIVPSEHFQDSTSALTESQISDCLTQSVVSRSRRSIWQNYNFRKKSFNNRRFLYMRGFKEDPEKVNPYKKPHKCHLCDLYFRSPSELKRHARIHSGERPYLCELCGSGFIRKCHLQLHVRRHTGERRHTCRECAMKFFTTSDLNRHMLIHKTNKPFKCHICTVTYRRASHLEQHIRNHVNATPFMCHLCGTFFTTSASLKKHEKHHFSIDPYSCSDCSASFTTSTSLSKHRRVHTDPHYNLLKICLKGMKISDQYECISSEGSPLSLVIRRVAGQAHLKIPGVETCANDKFNTKDINEDDITKRYISGWESHDRFHKKSPLQNGSNWSILEKQVRNAREDIPGESNGLREEGNGLHEEDNGHREKGKVFCEKDNHVYEEDNRVCEENNGVHEEGNDLCEEEDDVCEEDNGVYEKGNGLCKKDNHLYEKCNDLCEVGKKLHEECNGLLEEHSRLHEEHKDVHGEHNCLQEECSVLHEDCKDVHKDHNGVNEECSSLHEEHKDVHEEHTDVHKAHNGVNEECNGILEKHNEIHEEPSGLHGKHNGLHIECNDFHEEQDGLHEEDNDLHEEGNDLHVEQDDLHVEQDGLHVEQDGLHVEQDGLHVEQDGLHEEDNDIHEEGNDAEQDGLHEEDNDLHEEGNGVEQDGLHEEGNGLCEKSNHFANEDDACLTKERDINNGIDVSMKDNKPLDFEHDIKSTLDKTGDTLIKLSTPGKSYTNNAKNIQSQDCQTEKDINKALLNTVNCTEVLTKTITQNAGNSPIEEFTTLGSCMLQAMIDNNKASCSKLARKCIPNEDNYFVPSNMIKRSDRKSIIYNEDVDSTCSDGDTRSMPETINCQEDGAEMSRASNLLLLKNNVFSTEKKEICMYKNNEQNKKELHNMDAILKSQGKTSSLMNIYSKGNCLVKEIETVYQDVVEFNMDGISRTSERISPQDSCVQSIKNRKLGLNKLGIGAEHENDTNLDKYLRSLSKSPSNPSRHESQQSEGLHTDDETTKLFLSKTIPTSPEFPRVPLKLNWPKPLPVLPILFNDGKKSMTKGNSVASDMKKDGVREFSDDIYSLLSKEKQKDDRLKQSCARLSSIDSKRTAQQKPRKRSLPLVNEGYEINPELSTRSVTKFNEERELSRKSKHLAFVPSDKYQKYTRSKPLNKNQETSLQSVKLRSFLSLRAQELTSEVFAERQHLILEPPAESQKELEHKPTTMNCLADNKYGNAEQDLVPTSFSIHTNQVREAQRIPSIYEYMSGIPYGRLADVYSLSSHILSKPQEQHHEREILAMRENYMTNSLNFQISNILALRSCTARMAASSTCPSFNHNKVNVD